jgi:hypothetical protein
VSAEQRNVKSRRFYEDPSNKGKFDLLDELAAPNYVMQRAEGWVGTTLGVEWPSPSTGGCGRESVPNRTSFELHLPAELSAWYSAVEILAVLSGHSRPL